VTEKLQETHSQIAELTAFASQLRTASARLDSTPVDGPCANDCACLADNDVEAWTPVQLSAGPIDATPIACTLQPDARPQRMDRWQTLLTKVQRRTTTAAGQLRVEFSDGVDIGELASLIAAERQCCPFFGFTLTVDGRGTTLEIDAPERAAEIVAGVFGTAS
jgi:hypothetical protein